MGPCRYQGPSSGGVGHERGATILESPGASEVNWPIMDPLEPPPDDDDLHAFRRAVADVRPLPQKRRAATRPRPRPHARFTRAERDDVLRESLVVPSDPADLDTGEHASFRRPGVREDVLRKLKRGQFTIEAEIDLHGEQPG